jgi:hypothetical protein
MHRLTSKGIAPTGWAIRNRERGSICAAARTRRQPGVAR